MRTARAPITFDPYESGEEPPLRTDIRALLRRPPARGASTKNVDLPVSDQEGRQQWQVLQEFSHHGFVYQVRRKAEKPARAKRLTPREEEIVKRVAEGESNKSIAYSLGLSPSTVGVLIFRAAAKLGAKSRGDLLTAFSSRDRDAC